MSDVHLTVAVVAYKDGKYLMVQETDKSTARLVFNQPAGHVEAGETIEQAAIRETLEETGWQVELQGLVGIYTLKTSNGVSYCRICFSARPVKFVDGSVLDADIVQACWVNHKTLQQKHTEMRSPLVLQSIHDYENGTIHPLSVFK